MHNTELELLANSHARLTSIKIGPPVRYHSFNFCFFRCDSMQFHWYFWCGCFFFGCSFFVVTHRFIIVGNSFYDRHIIPTHRVKSLKTAHVVCCEYDKTMRPLVLNRATIPQISETCVWHRVHTECMKHCKQILTLKQLTLFYGLEKKDSVFFSFW